MVQGQLGANTRAVTLELEQALEELRAAAGKASRSTLHPRLFRPANFIETAVGNVQRDLLIGSVLVIVVLFLFLFNCRTAFICATAIPISLLGAVIVLDYFGIGLNIMVLGGLAIALGEVVDDAIIDTENIFRRLRENRAQPQPAARCATWCSTPRSRCAARWSTRPSSWRWCSCRCSRWAGVAGKLFAPLGLAYILAILASLVVALTLTPALCYLLLARSAAAEARIRRRWRWLKPRYRAAARAHRALPGPRRRASCSWSSPSGSACCRCSRASSSRRCAKATTSCT